MTGGKIGDRLLAEAETNLAINVLPGQLSESFEVQGRGELQLGCICHHSNPIAILIFFCILFLVCLNFFSFFNIFRYFNWEYEAWRIWTLCFTSKSDVSSCTWIYLNLLVDCIPFVSVRRFPFAPWATVHQQGAHLVSQAPMFRFPTTADCKAFSFSGMKNLGYWAAGPPAASTSRFSLMIGWKFS